MMRVDQTCTCAESYELSSAYVLQQLSVCVCANTTAAKDKSSGAHRSRSETERESM